MRLDSLDVHRGITMFGMIFANCKGQNPPWWLKHASWDGLYPPDLIFPAFMFIMGMAVPLAVTKNKPLTWRKVLRVVALFLIGIFINLMDNNFSFY